MDELDADLHLAAPASIIAAVLERLDDALYRAENLDQGHRAEDLRIDRILARQ